MKQNLLGIYSLCIATVAISILPFCLNAQTFQWAKKFGGTGAYGAPTAIAVDAPGNVYTVGNFTGTIDFDPGAGTANLTGTADVFVSKLTVTGSYAWAKVFTGTTSNDWGEAIALDATGNVYVTGAFSNTVDFDPGPGTFNLTAIGSYDVFVCKLSTAGNLLWAKRFGGSVDDWGQSIVLDASGNVYVTGVFEGTVDFDPNAGTFNMTATGTPYDIYVNKLTSAGNFVWARKMGGSGQELVTCSSLDASGNIYVSGSFEGTADFDPGGTAFNLTSAGATDIFVAKINSAGTFGWAKRMGGTTFDQAYSLAIDGSGNVVTVGYFYGTSDFDPGAAVVNLTSTGGGQDIFISKLNASGNYVWARRIGNANLDVCYGVDIDAAGNIYYTGGFFGTLDFDPGPGTANFTTATGDLYISKLNSSGNYSWTCTVGGTGSAGSRAITTDVYGNIYTTGFFSGTVDFNPGSGTNNLTSTGNSDMFVYKLSQPNPLPIELLSFNATSLNDKSIFCEWATAAEINNDFFTIEKSKDGIEFEEAGSVNGAGNSTQTLNYNFEDKDPYSGISCYRLKQTDFDGQYSYSDVVSVKLKEENQFYLYPNPAQDQFSIFWPDKDQSLYQVNIYDITGHLIFAVNKTDQTQESTTIQVSSIPKGIYTVQLVSNNLIEHKRIVIQ